VAEKLALETAGKIFLEDAGFDWKVGEAVCSRDAC
jgi:hypothetical protein